MFSAKSLIPEINKQQENIIDFLKENQKLTGEFESYESYPDNHPKASLGWHYVDRSPFIHSNIIYSLLQVDHPGVNAMVKEGVIFIKSLQESNGFWRFWPHGGETHNVPLDIDDSSICSVVLEKNGYLLNNKGILLSNQDDRGHFNTWILPDRRLLKFPLFYWFLIKDLKKIRPILGSEMLSPGDCEPGVEANVLLYLGQNSITLKSIKGIIHQVKTGNMPLQYYHDPLFIFFHISRAFYSGISLFRELEKECVNFAESRIGSSNATIFDKIVSLLCILNFDKRNNAKVLETLPSILEYSQECNWESYEYFTSKDKSFQAGSPFLTASYALEAINRSIN